MSKKSHYATFPDLTRKQKRTHIPFCLTSVLESINLIMFRFVIRAKCAVYKSIRVFLKIEVFERAFVLRSTHLLLERRSVYLIAIENRKKQITNNFIIIVLNVLSG